MKSISSRHWAFLGLFLLVLIGMLVPFRPSVQPTEETRRLFAMIDSLTDSSTIIVSFDHEASALPEIRPLAVAILRHAFMKNVKVVGLALMAEGTVIGYSMMEQVAEEYHRAYGTDYVYLGFKPQYIAAILSMGESISQTFPQDYFGTPLASIPMMKNFANYQQVAGVVSIADGNMPTHWMEYGRARYNVRISSVMTAAMVTTYDPYLSSGQLYSLVGGLKGAAEYEALLGQGGGGARGMLAQSASHIYVIVLILVGNFLYFRARRTRGEA